jgi:hypothetical protein
MVTVGSTVTDTSGAGQAELLTLKTSNVTGAFVVGGCAFVVVVAFLVVVGAAVVAVGNVVVVDVVVAAMVVVSAVSGASVVVGAVVVVAADVVVAPLPSPPESAHDIRKRRPAPSASAMRLTGQE